jgi:hypothetical protein
MVRSGNTRISEGGVQRRVWGAGLAVSVCEGQRDLGAADSRLEESTTARLFRSPDAGLRGIEETAGMVRCDGDVTRGPAVDQRS